MERRPGNDILLILGIVLLVVGFGALARTLGVLPPFVLQAFGILVRAARPLALIVLGVIVIVVASRGGFHPTLPPAGTRLYRSRRDRMIAGVAGGLSEYLGIDPIAVRLAFVLLGLVSFGTALLLYIVLAVLVPEAPEEGSVPGA